MYLDLLLFGATSGALIYLAWEEGHDVSAVAFLSILVWNGISYHALFHRQLDDLFLPYQSNVDTLENAVLVSSKEYNTCCVWRCCFVFPTVLQTYDFVLDESRVVRHRVLWYNQRRAWDLHPVLTYPTNQPQQGLLQGYLQDVAASLTVQNYILVTSLIAFVIMAIWIVDNSWTDRLMITFIPMPIGYRLAYLHFDRTKAYFDAGSKVLYKKTSLSSHYGNKQELQVPQVQASTTTAAPGHNMPFTTRDENYALVKTTSWGDDWDEESTVPFLGQGA